MTIIKSVLCEKQTHEINFSPESKFHIAKFFMKKKDQTLPVVSEFRPKTKYVK